MTMTRRSCLAAIAAALSMGRQTAAIGARKESTPMNDIITLPAPQVTSSKSIEQLLAQRRSVRAFDDNPLALEQLSQLLWAAQGRTHPQGFRTAPSAGALYPLELFVIAGDVTGLAQGVYRYQADSHKLNHIGGRDLRRDAATTALGQSWISGSQAIILIAAVFRRTTVKYSRRGERYVHMEAGHVAQNIYLQATAMELCTTVVGAFDDERLHALVGMERDETPLSLLPLGRMPI